MFYQLLDYFFFIFHTVLILFNSLGWIVKATRIWNLLTLSITAFSWFILGIWHGWGYCFCTDWHWMVRRNLGYSDMSNSYNHFLVLKLTGINFSETLVNWVTGLVFLLSIMISICMNINDFRSKKMR